MKIRKFVASAVAALLVSGGLVATTVLPASAHTPQVSDTCNSITVDLQNYQTIAGSAEVLGEKPLISAAVEAKDAVYAVEYEFVFKKEHPNSPRWEAEGWNADSNPNSEGWHSTGVTRQGELLSAAVEAQEAVYGEAPVIQAAVAANATPNVVTVEVDGVLVVDTTFGSSYNNTIAVDGTQNHTYKVRVRAFDDPNGANGWSFNHNGTTEKCAPVVTYPPVITPAVPNFSTAADCDTDGTYVLPAGVAAQNHNPETGLYGVELDGYRLYVRNTTGDFGGPGEYTWQAYGIGAAGFGDYPKGTSVGGKVDGQGNPKAGGMVSGTFTVDAATGDCPVVIPEKPADKVTSTETSAANCEEGTFVTTTTTTTVSSVYVEETNSWVDGTPVVTSASSSREATETECPTVVVEEPEEPNTPEEPVVEEEVVVVPAAAEAKGLAVTGGDLNPIVPIGGAILLLGGLTALLWRRRVTN